MIENSPTSMMFADRDLKIRYMNPASFKLLKRIEAYLPCKAEEMIGQSIDMFHSDPEHQRRLLADPKNLPHRALIQVGPEHADLLVNAIMDRSGNYLGPMLTWDIVTEKLEAEAREAEMAADTAAINQLLAGMGQAGTEREVVLSALEADPGVVRLVLRGVLGGRPRREGPAVRGRIGLGRRGVPPLEPGGEVPRGGRAARPGLAGPGAGRR